MPTKNKQHRLEYIIEQRTECFLLLYFSNFQQTYVHVHMTMKERNEEDNKILTKKAAAIHMTNT